MYHGIHCSRKTLRWAPGPYVLAVETMTRYMTSGDEKCSLSRRDGWHVVGMVGDHSEEMAQEQTPMTAMEIWL